MNSQIIEHTQTAIWAGLLATTSARSDVLQMEFLEGVQAAIPLSNLSLCSRIAINAPTEANKRPILDLMLHPLLDMAAEKYAADPLEGRLILRYLNQQLRKLARTGEGGCPTEDSDLENWIRGAFTFARGIAQNEKAVLVKLLASFDYARLREGHKIVQEVLKPVDGNKPDSMTEQVVLWYQATNGASAPGYYGKALERAVECVDMAVWMVWSPELSEVPDVSSKLGMSM